MKWIKCLTAVVKTLLIAMSIQIVSRRLREMNKAHDEVSSGMRRVEARNEVLLTMISGMRRGPHGKSKPPPARH